MKIALAQMRVRAGNIEKNLKTMLAQIEKAKAASADVVIFPELAVTGYLLGDTWERTSFLREAELANDVLRQAAQNIIVVFGNVGIDWLRKNEDGRVRKYNAAFVAQNGNFLKNEIIGLPFWVKSLLPNYRLFDDSRHFFDLRKLALERNVTLEKLLCPVDLKTKNKTARAGLIICEDGWDVDYGFSPGNALHKKFKLDFFINISASPFGENKHDKRIRNFSSLCKKTCLPTLFTNAFGTQNVGKTIYGFDGQSTVFDNAGSPLSTLPPFQEGLLFCQWSQETKNFSCSAPSAPSMTAVCQRQVGLENILKLVCEEWGLQRFIVAVSGGIDSALSATMFAKVFGSDSVKLINMPSKFNSTLTQSAAQKLAANLQCSYAVLGIQDGVELTFDALKTLKKSKGFEDFEITNFVSENIQARDRGGRLLAAAAAAGSSVFPCNANKSETTVGYSTLYGDLNGFLAPIADLWKHQIYELARHYNETVFRTEVIPEATLNVTPSAELSLDQDVMQNKGDPIVYPYHDYLFRSWVEAWDRQTPYDCLLAYDENRLDTLIGCSEGLSKMLFPKRELFISDLERWWRLYQGMGTFKRAQTPPIIALSRRSFGYDHRENLGGVIFDSSYLTLRNRN